MALSRKPIEIVNQGNHQLLTKANHWERVPLSDVAVVQNGFAFKSELFTHSEGKPLIRIRDIEDGWTENFYSGEYSDEFVVRKGDILIGMDGDFNAAIWQGVDGLLNQRVCRLIPTAKNFSDKFLFICLQPYLNAINAETSSVTVKHLSSKTIGKIPLPLPPLNEQHRIVAKIEELFSELDKGIENLKTARAQLKVYRQALLKHAFEGKLTAQWRAENRDKLESVAALQKRIQHERTRRYQQQLADWEANGGGKPKAPKPLPPLTAEELAELPELPEGWGWVRLASIVTVISGYAFKSGDFVSAGVPVVKIANVGYSEFVDKDQEYLDSSFLQTQKDFLVSPDDFLLALTRPITNNRTKVCRYPKDAPLALLNQRVSAMKDVEINPEFLYSYFGTSLFKESIRSKFSETLQPNLSPKDLEACPIPICALAEQAQIFCEIEARLSEVDQLELTITTSLQQAEALRQSILKKAFSGQLVSQDPHDEPASKLLARIKAERATAEENSAVRQRGKRG